jgi:hypothetical protein
MNWKNSLIGKTFKSFVNAPRFLDPEFSAAQQAVLILLFLLPQFSREIFDANYVF